MLDIHYEEMTKIVDGDANNLIRKLNFEPGTLNIFQGNECLHRYVWNFISNLYLTVFGCSSSKGLAQKFRASNLFKHTV